MGRHLEYQMRRNAGSSPSGFSLLETLGVVAVIAIVIGMAILNFTTILPNFKANSALDQVLSQLRSAREQAIAHRRQVQVSFPDAYHIAISEVSQTGVLGPMVTYAFEGGGHFVTFATVPDLPAPYNFGNAAPVFFGGLAGGPPIMRFSTNGSFVDGGNTLLNGTVFIGIPGNPATARAISVLGATGRVRPYHWNGSAWLE
jgi:type II secretory pathway pseudopilin PulG